MLEYPTWSLAVPVSGCLLSRSALGRSLMSISRYVGFMAGAGAGAGRWAGLGAGLGGRGLSIGVL